MTTGCKMRPLDIRRDLAALGELIEISFAGELARRGAIFGRNCAHSDAWCR